jgi:hypothetical protein
MWSKLQKTSSQHHFQQHSQGGRILVTHKEKFLALRELGGKLMRIVKWLKDSRLKVNRKRTELCIFHQNKNTDGNLTTQLYYQRFR